MRILVFIISESLPSLGYLTLIMAITMYIFAVAGKQLYADKYTDLETPLRWSFAVCKIRGMEKKRV